jgi:hypothetical protein
MMMTQSTISTPDSFRLVKSCPGRRRCTPYPDMAWEPKQAFHAIAKYYASG